MIIVFRLKRNLYNQQIGPPLTPLPSTVLALSGRKHGQEIRTSSCPFPGLVPQDRWMAAYDDAVCEAAWGQKDMEVCLRRKSTPTENKSRRLKHSITQNGNKYTR